MSVNHFELLCASCMRGLAKGAAPSHAVGLTRGSERLMSKRQTLSTETVAAVARENAGHPVTAERAATYAGIMEDMLTQLEALRQLPLKDVEPATVFRPIEVDKA